jgi:CHAT domain-containing protein
MKEDKVCKIYIEKAEEDYRYLIEDSSRGTTSFRDRMTIPHPSRDRILKKLKFLGATVGWTKGAKKQKITNRGLEVAKNENIKENIEKIGGLIFKYMIPLSCKDYLSEIDTEYVVLSTDDVEIPWELMHDGTDFYCLKYSIGRKIQARVQFKPTKRQKTDILNALFIANPTEDLPDAEKEVDTIVTNLKEEKIKFQYLKGENATIDSLFEMLETEKFDIFHYAGHAGFNIKHPEESIIRLYDDEITAKYLLNIFEEVPPRLVFMNACESAASKEIEYLEYESKLTGMATAFISAGVDAYIGTFWPVHDKMASELSINLYKRIVEGESIGSALKNAKATIFQEYGNFSNTWASFVLYGDPITTLLKLEGEEKIQDKPTRIELEERTCELQEPFSRKIEFSQNQVVEVFNNIRRAYRETKASLNDRINLKVIAQGTPVLKERKKKDIGKAILIKNFTLEVSGEKESVAEFIKQLATIHIFWYGGYKEVADTVESFLKRTERDKPSLWWKIPGFIDSIDDIVRGKEN